MPDHPRRRFPQTQASRTRPARLADPVVRTGLALALALVIAGCAAPTPARGPRQVDSSATARPAAGDALAASATVAHPGSSAADVEAEPGRVGEAVAGSDPGASESLDSAGGGPTEVLSSEVATARAGDRPAANRSPTADPAATPDPGASGTGQARSAPAPLASGDALAVCRDLAAPMAEALGREPDGLRLEPADVEDPVWGTLLDGCQLSVEAPGDQLRVGDSFDSLPAYRLRAVLAGAGWREDPAYASVAPGESRAGYLRSGGLCIIQGRMRAPDDRSCAGADPTCGLPPVQLWHALALRCARF